MGIAVGIAGNWEAGATHGKWDLGHGPGTWDLGHGPGTWTWDMGPGGTWDMGPGGTWDMGPGGWDLGGWGNPMGTAAGIAGDWEAGATHGNSRRNSR